MGNLEKKIENQILNFLKHDHCHLEDYTPGLCVRVYSKGRLKVNLRMGLTYQYYDLASLTKIMFTVPAMIKILERESKKNEKSRLSLKTPIHSILSWWPKSNINVKHLLTHTSGLPWWRPIYKEFPQGLVFAPQKIKNLKKLNKEGDINKETQKIKEEKKKIFLGLSDSKPSKFLKQKMLKFKRQPVGRCVYSDPGFWLLGFIIEEIEQKFLSDLWSQNPFSSDIYFHLQNEPPFSRSSYAPTGTCRWRKKLLQGEVHDRNAWAFQGIAPHAGLFSSLEGVSRWALDLRKKYQKPKNLSFIRKFTKRAIKKDIGHWGLGFMKPYNLFGGAGKFFSPSAFGHTGFSGTSFWFDPRRDILVIILSNRTAEIEDHYHYSTPTLSKSHKKKKKSLRNNEQETHITLGSLKAQKKPFNETSLSIETPNQEKKEDLKENSKNKYEIDIYETFETKRIQRMKKSPFSKLRKEIHNIVLQLKEL